MTARRAALLRYQSAVAIGDSAGSCAFVGAEFGPDGEVVGDFQGLIEIQVELVANVENAPAAGELGRGGAVENDVVELGFLERVGVRVAHDRVDAFDAAEVAEVFV